jgi:DNA-binding response OmpR family regulator
MKKKILIADDDVNITAAVAARLEASHYDVLTAFDGFEAIKLALRETPDLILLDVWMPIGIGLSVAERLKERGLDIPIVFLTACKKAELRAAARAVGAAGFIEKPYNPETLLETIEQALSRHAGPVESQSRL